MGWPFTFGTATSPTPMSNLDLMFNQAAAQLSIPCSALGTNAISLTPLVNCPALTSYNELGGYRFRAVGNSTAPVTIQYNGLGFLNAYKGDGASQIGNGDLLAGQQYIATFSQALNGGLGGFFIESPSIPVTAASNWFQPGGRLTLQSAVPVMTSSQTLKQVIFFAPYQHQFVPVYNGSIIQMVNFCSGISDQVGLQLNMGAAANFAANTNFDVFLTLIGGVPTLCAIAWTNNTTRATTLTIFGGFLTNAGSATAQTGPSTNITLPVNQGTFLGTYQTTTQGVTQFVFGGAASGGSAASFNLANYYNTVLYNTQVIDNGATYTYSSSTVRQARASAGNQISFVQPSSERSMFFTYNTCISVSAANGVGVVGMGFNTTTAFTSTNSRCSPGAGAQVESLSVCLPFATTGFATVTANEQGDGTNANTFNFSGGTGVNMLSGSLWL